MKRILMFMFVLLGLVSVVNAVVDDATIYYSFDTSNTSGTTMFDLSGNDNDGTCVNMVNCDTISGGIINETTNFDGIAEYINLGSTPFINTWKGGTYSISAWIKQDNLGSYTIYSEGNKASTNIYGYIGITNGLVTIQSRQGASGDQKLLQSTNLIPANVWTHIVYVTSGNLVTGKIYVNDVDVATTIVSNTGATEPTGLNGVGVGTFIRSSIVNYFKNQIDELAIYNKALSVSEVSVLYNGGVGFNPYTAGPTPDPVLTYTSIKSNNISITNNTFYNSSIDFETIVLNTSTNGNVNHTYSLNGAAAVQYASNNLTGSVNLNLIEGSYNISFSAFNNETSVNSTNYSFIVDLTAPVISIIGNVSQENYIVNFSTIFAVNYSISGKKSCSLNITYLTANESDSNFFINCTDTQVFTRTGLYNGFLTAEDNAGNIVTGSVNGTINGNINVFFAQKNTSIIFNYTPTLIHPDGRITFPVIQTDGSIQLSPFNNGTLDLGIHTIQFEKIGYITQNFTQIVNTTNAGINVTFNASDSVINLEIRDKITGSIISGPTFDVDFVATVGLNTNTSNGTLSITNTFFLNESYRVDITNALYSAESIFFTFTNQEEVDIVAYMSLLNNTKNGFVTVKVSDRFGNPLSGVKVEALQWTSSVSKYVPVSQQKTDEKGLGVLNVILDDELYKFRATLDSLQVESVDQRITLSENGKEIPLRLSALESEQTYILENVLTVVTEDFNNQTNISIITFDWEDLTGISQTVCINAYRIINGADIPLTNDSTQCTEGVSGTLIKAFYINSSFTTNLKAEIKIDNDKIKIKSFPHYATFSLPRIIENLKLTPYVTPILMIIAIVFGFVTNIYLGTIALMLASIGSIYIVPTVLNGSIVAFFFFVGLMTLSGGKKP